MTSNRFVNVSIPWDKVPYLLNIFTHLISHVKHYTKFLVFLLAETNGSPLFFYNQSIKVRRAFRYIHCYALETIN